MSTLPSSSAKETTVNPDNVDPMTIWAKPTDRARVAKRRAKNRVARASRRVNRLRGA